MTPRRGSAPRAPSPSCDHRSGGCGGQLSAATFFRSTRSSSRASVRALGSSSRAALSQLREPTHPWRHAKKAVDRHRTNGGWPRVVLRAGPRSSTTYERVPAPGRHGYLLRPAWACRQAPQRSPTTVRIPLGPNDDCGERTIVAGLLTMTADVADERLRATGAAHDWCRAEPYFGRLRRQRHGKAVESARRLLALVSPGRRRHRHSGRSIHVAS